MAKKKAGKEEKGEETAGMSFLIKALENYVFLSGFETQESSFLKCFKYHEFRRMKILVTKNYIFQWL